MSPEAPKTASASASTRTFTPSPTVRVTALAVPTKAPVASYALSPAVMPPKTGRPR